MSTTDQPASDIEQQKAADLVAPFEALPIGYRTHPIALAVIDSLDRIGARVHALESVEHAEVRVVEFEGCACHGAPLPEADGAEHTSMSDGIAAAVNAQTGGFYVERSAPRADGVGYRHVAAERATTAPAAVARVLAGARLSRDDARDIHDLVNSRTTGTAKQKLTERLELAERERDEATAAAEGWRAAAEATQRDADEHHLFGIRGPEEGVDLLDWAREYARSAYGTSKLIYSPGAVVSLQHAALALQTLADDAKAQRAKQVALVNQHHIEYQAAHALARQHHEDAIRYREERDGARARADHLQSELNAMHGFTDEDIARLVDERLVKVEEPAPPTEGPKHLKLSGMNGTPWAAPSAPSPSAEPVAAAINHDPILDEPDRGLGERPRPLPAQIDNAIVDTHGGVAALLRHFGIDPEAA